MWKFLGLFFLLGSVASAQSSGYDVIVIAGQSNAVGYGCGPFTDESKEFDSRIFTLDEKGTAAPARDPLWNPNGTGAVGFGMTFARLYAKSTKRNVLLVSVALGDTSVLFWDDKQEDLNFGSSAHPLPDGLQLWQTMQRQTRAAMKLPGKNKLVAFLWHQGERDYGAIVDVKNSIHAAMPDAATYATKLESFLRSIRTSFADLPGGDDLPMILGEVGTFWARVVKQRDPEGKRLRELNDAFTTVSRNVPRTGVASAEGLTPGSEAGCSSLPQVRLDIAHFNSASLVEFGRRYYSAFRKVTK